MTQVKELKKEISVDFFDVHISEHSSETLLNVMEAFKRKNPTIEDKNYEKYEGDDIIRLVFFDKYKDDIYFGKWAKLRKGELPKKNSIYKEDEKDIELSDGECVTERYHFIYAENTKTLVAARNRDSRSVNRLAAYLREKTEYYGIQFKPILKTDAYSRLKQFPDIHKLVVNFAAEAAVSGLRESDPVSKIADLRKTYGGLEFTLIIKASKDNAAPIKKSAVIDSAQTVMDGLVKFNKFQVFGEPAENLSESFVDFVNDRFGDKIEIKYTVDILESQVYKELEACYKRRRKEIEQRQ